MSGLLSQSARAITINGSIGFDGSGMGTTTATTSTLTFNSGVTVDITIGDYNNIPRGTAATFAPITWNTSSGALLSSNSGEWSFSSGGNSYSFDLLSLTSALMNDDTVSVSGTGRLRITGYDPTFATFNVEGTGSNFSFAIIQASNSSGCRRTQTVTNNNDPGTGSLREAVTDACADGTIDFAANVRGAINLTSGELLINKNLTITGPGATLLSVQRSTTSGTPSFRIFHVVNAKVVIAGLTVAGGQVTGNSFPGSYGGGILNEEDTLTLRECVLSGNSASNNAGAILNYRGVLNLANCTLDQNSAVGSGGAILNADYGGGSSNQANLILTNCTLNKNQAGQYGGAIYSDGTSSGYATLELINCTLNENTAGLGAGGIYNDALNPGSSGTASLTLKNTILRAGASGANLVNDFGTITSNGNNLSSDAAGGPAGTAPGGFLNAPGDIRNTDPQLNPSGLANNGGGTPTIALLPSSPAINAGNDTFAPQTDQRQYLRVGASDIGAFEFGGQPLRITSITRPDNTHIHLEGKGVPSATHTIQFSPDLDPTQFDFLGSVITDANGAWHYDDTLPANISRRFYRLTYP